MFTIASITTAQATTYEYGEGEWVGKLAAEWGIEGKEVTDEEFLRAVEGQHPVTGQQIIKHQEPRTYTNKHGKEITTAAHRPGVDAVFSAPKSVAILAYMSGNQALKDKTWDAHKAAVKAALKLAEQYACVRLSGGKWEQSGNIVASLHHHDRARPDDKLGYASPLIHSHAVIMNMTRGPNGIHAMNENQLFASQRFLTAAYRAFLSENLQQIGIALEVDRETGAPEVKGISRAYIEAASPRSDEVQRKAEEITGRLALAGSVVVPGPGLNQAAARLARKTKNFSEEEMLAHDQKLEQQFGLAAHRVATEVLERGPILRTSEEIGQWAQSAVTHSIGHITDFEAVGDQRAFMTAALERHMTLTTFDAIQSEMGRREKSGELVYIDREERMAERTTQTMLKLERENIAKTLEGKGTVAPLAAGGKADELIESVSYREQIRLNSDQYNAVLKTLESADRFNVWQGKAGVGKTTALRVLAEAARRSGFAVQGIAPTGIATRQMTEADINSQTLKSFFGTKDLPNEGPRLIILDESSLSGTKDINALFNRIRPEDRLLLVGDRNQHQAIAAGAPFEQFQSAGTNTIWINTILRQQENPEYLKAVEVLQVGKVADALAVMEKMGAIIEVPDDEQAEIPGEARFQAVANSLIKHPKGNLAVAPGNYERVAINWKAHRGLQKLGLVEKDEHETSVLVNGRIMSEAERQTAWKYKPGIDVVRFREGSKVYGIKKGEYARVISTTLASDQENKLTVEMEDGRRIEYDPARLYGVEVFRDDTRAFAVGDRVQFRRPYDAPRRQWGKGKGWFGSSRRQAVTSELGIIENIEDEIFTLRMADGRQVRLDTREFRHLDYGYASTSMLSQSLTAKHGVMIHIDTKAPDLMVNLRMLTVAATRGAKKITIFTDSKDRLLEAVSRRKDKEIAIKALEETESWAIKREAERAEREMAEAMTGEESSYRFDDLPVTSPTLKAGLGRSHREVRAFTKTVTQVKYEQPVIKREKSGFIRTKKSIPCPVCERTRYCSIARNGEFVICTKEPSNHPTKDGKAWIHPLDGKEQEQVARVRETQIEVTQYTRAPIERLDAVNRQLLKTLGLTSRDRKDLERRGLDLKTIEEKGYKSTPLPAQIGVLMERFKDTDLKGIPGFFTQGERWRLNIGEWTDKKGIAHSFHQGYLIPVRDIDGNIQGFQIRRADVRQYEVIDKKTGLKKLKEEPRYIWLSGNERENGTSPGAPMHYLNVDKMRESGTVVITEGALKADVSSHLLGNRHGMIALAGVNSFPVDLGHRLKQQIPELRTVVIAYDADADRKKEVSNALEQLHKSLQAAGLKTQNLEWSESEGKGLDDYLQNAESRAKVEQDLNEIKMQRAEKKSVDLQYRAAEYGQYAG